MSSAHIENKLSIYPKSDAMRGYSQLMERQKQGMLKSSDAIFILIS